MKNIKNLVEIIVGILIFVIVFFISQTKFLSGTADRFDFTVFNYRENIISEDIVIVALDDSSINNPDFKRYQDIDRADYVKVLKSIFKGGPKVVGMDVFFFNPAEDKKDDFELSELFKANKNLIAVNEFDFDQGNFIEPADTITVSNIQRGYANLTSGSYDQMGVINQVPVIFDTNDVQSIKYEPFVFRVFRLLESGLQTAIVSEDDKVYTIVRGNDKTYVPMQDLAVNINFYGDNGSFKYVSFFDVWSGVISPDEFANKIVLIGSTAHDIHDEFFTPISFMQMMPGVEIHANLLQTIMDENFIFYQTHGQKMLSVVFILVVSFMVFSYFSFVYGTILTVVLLVAYYVSSVYSFKANGVVVSVFWTISAGVIFWGATYIIRFIKSEKQKKQIRDTFSKYVAKDIVDEILKNPTKVNLGGESREITIFFSDLAGFTSISEKLKTAELMQLLNDYLDKMSSIILEEKGTIDKYMGDAIMAFWGAPLEMKDHATRACITALRQQKALPEINSKLRERGLPTVSVRIGINTGIADVGNVGTHERLDYTAIGDNVNLGSRLEGINKQYGTGIIISQSTKDIIGNKFFVRELDLICVKGKTKPIKIYELIAFHGEQTDAQENIKKVYETGIRLYCDQKWNEAKKKFALLKDDNAAKKMIERIGVLKKEKLSKDWDGSYSFITK